MAEGKKGKIKLKPSHRKAADAYVKNGFHSKTGAMRAAGYSESTAKAQTALVFGRDDVKEYLEQEQDRLRRKYIVDEDFVVQRLARIANSGEVLAPFRKPQPDGTLRWDFTDATADDLSVISGMTTETVMDGRGPDAVKVLKFKIDVPDPKGALDSLARKLGLFNDKVTVNGEVSIIERIQAGRARARGKEK